MIGQHGGSTPPPALPHQEGGPSAARLLDSRDSLEGHLNICIYTRKQEPEATFKGREHVIPAGIGGKERLPAGFVSDEANGLFSSLELDFMREGLISLPRQFFGPGKRGRLSSNVATQSKVHIMYAEEKGQMPLLGYISLGIPHVIDQVALSQREGPRANLHPQPGQDPQELLAAFVSRLKKWNGREYRLIEEKDIGDVVLLGYHNGGWYVAAASAEGVQEAHHFARILMTTKGTQMGSDSAISKSHVRACDRMAFNIEHHFRVCAKTAVNCLALLKGQEYVLKPIFDPVREYVLNGGPNTFVRFFDSRDPQSAGFLRRGFPQDSHKVILIATLAGIVAKVSFYGDAFPVEIKLSERCLDSIFVVHVCDWRNSAEYTPIDVPISPSGTPHDSGES